MNLLIALHIFRRVFPGILACFLLVPGIGPAGASTGEVVPPKHTSPGEPHQPLEASPSQKILDLKDIPPLYTEPALKNEGQWQWNGMPMSHDGRPLLYTTTYRPSERFPNSIVHLMLFDLRRVSMSLYLGYAELGGTRKTSVIPRELRPRLAAITNALWQVRHAGRAGVIFRGKEIKPMVAGVATILITHDGKVDIREWNDNLAANRIRDAIQLKHLIIEDGKVVTTVSRNGRQYSAEIGLGSLLNESMPVFRVPVQSPQPQNPTVQDEKGAAKNGGSQARTAAKQPKGPSKNKKKKKVRTVLNLTSGPLWFLATRSGFGIRRDGNLVFALGHHISTRALAKSLVLAGCIRGIHGDANPGNAVGNIYLANDQGQITQAIGLSPRQHPWTLRRYLRRGYAKDFFAYFRKEATDEKQAGTGEEHAQRSGNK